MDIHIESVDVEDAILNNKIKYNTNNHYTESPPLDYEEKSKQTETRNWIHLKANNLIATFDIDLKKYRWLIEANNMGMHTKTFPNAYKDELQCMLNDYESIPFHEPMFVRTEHVSLKCGQHGTGPYTNMLMIIESLVTCTPGHAPINPSMKEGDEIIKIYLLKWNELEHEYRVFVYNRKVTCISQQHLFDVIEGFTQDLIPIHTATILDYFNSTIEPALDLDSYCIDIGIQKNGEAYFIEINPFGSQYSSGSSLFHWIEDDLKLCSDGSMIHFKFTRR
jgi:hypothetical protein